MVRRATLMAVVIVLPAAVLGQPQPPEASRLLTSQRVMGDLSADGVQTMMEGFNRALGVDCTHCHLQDRWADETKPAFAVARNKLRMVQVLNQQLEDVGEVTCWTCHRGQIRPSRLPRASLDAELASWPADLTSVPENRKMAMAVYNVTLGVSCDHCHSADWKNAEKKPMKRVDLMTAMFDEFPKYMPPTARTQCYMCHKGTTKPEARPPQ